MIAVTGANGLLGKYIIERLLQAKLQVIAITRQSGSEKKIFSSDLITERYADITDPITLTEALQGASCVIHTAAYVSLNPNASKKMIEVNVNGTSNIVDICLQLNIPRLIHISSVAALGKQKGITTIREESKWIAGEFNTDYAESKHMAELEVYRGLEEGLSIAIVNPSVILAPANWNRSSAKLFKFVWDEKPFYTEGQFNYVDARDVSELIYQLYQNNSNGQKYIASSGSVSFIDFFRKVAQRFNKKSPSININPFLIQVFAFLESIRCRITGGEPMVDGKALKNNREFFQYSNEKARNELKVTFRPLDETLDWCCSEYLQKITTNK
jgi:dihydroflavonol-4-reductase